MGANNILNVTPGALVASKTATAREFARCQWRNHVQVSEELEEWHKKACGTRFDKMNAESPAEKEGGAAHLIKSSPSSSGASAAVNKRRSSRGRGRGQAWGLPLPGVIIVSGTLSDSGEGTPPLPPFLYI